jgi:hypothetical protein
LEAWIPSLTLESILKFGVFRLVLEVTRRHPFEPHVAPSALELVRNVEVLGCQRRNQPHLNQPPTTNMNITISFTPEGTAHCLWTEALPLHELGQLQITRASNIEFNNATQHWEVKDRRGHVRFFARLRSACLDWERQNLQPE